MDDNKEILHTETSTHYGVSHIRRILLLLVEHWRFYALIVGTAVLISAIFSLVVHSKYTAHASLLPSAGAAPAGLGFVAGLVPEMLSTFSDQNTISSFLFPYILKSEDIILDVCNTEFDVVSNGKRIQSTLAKFWKWKRPEDIVAKFLKKSKVSYSMETGIIHIYFTTKYPELSAKIVEIWLNKLDLFVQQKLSSEARANYEYMLKRKEETLSELQKSEDELRKFIETHRNFERDPMTNLEYQRFYTEWQVKNSTFEIVMTELEKSRLKMETGVPSLRIMETPKIPTKRSFPKRKQIVALTFIISSFFAIIAITLIDLFKSHRDFLQRLREKFRKKRTN